MDITKTKAQMKKGILELCILYIISSNEAYSSDILEALKAAKLIVVEGTLYPLLTRLKNEGLLSYRWIESKSGPPRKYYNITESGKNNVKELDASWKEIVRSVNNLSKYNKTKI